MLVGMLVLFVGVVCGFVWLMLDSGEGAVPVAPVVVEKPAAVREPAPTAPITEEVAREEVPVVATANPEPAEVAAPEEGATEKRSTGGSGLIKGKVTGADDRPGGGVALKLEPMVKDPLTALKKNPPLMTVTTDGEGAFLFEQVPWGGYIVVAETADSEMRMPAHLSRQRKEVILNIQLGYSGSIGGIVRNSKGDVVKGATVFPSAWKYGSNEGGFDHAVSLSLSVLSDEGGRFLIPKVGRDVDFKICAKAEGYAPAFSEFAETGREDVEVVLLQGGKISGTVVENKDDRTLSGVDIVISARDFGMNMSTRSDAQGRFNFDGVRPGTHRINIRHDQMVMLDSKMSIEVAEGQDVRDVRLELHQGGVISGRIYDEDTGAGLGDVRLLAQAANLHNDPTTDSEGYYRIEGLPPGAYNLSFQSPEGYPQTQNIFPQQNGPNQKRVIVHPGEEVGDIDFTLSRGIQVSGVVEDVAGTPLTGSSINGWDQQGGTQHAWVQAADDGTFILAIQSPSPQFVVSAHKQGYRTLSNVPIAVTEDGVQDLRIIMDVAAQIKGEVVDRAGNPVPQLQVMARLAGEGGGRGGQTNEQGAFHINGLEEGHYEIFLGENQGRNNQGTPAKSVIVAKGQVVSGLRLVYEREQGLTISGRITNRAGEALTEVSVSAQYNFENDYHHANAQSDKDGKYTLSRLRDGDYRLDVHHHRHTRTAAEGIAAGTRNVDFVLAGRGKVAGRIEDAQTGEAVTEFELFARKGQIQELNPQMNNQYQFYYDEEGQFSLENIEEGDVTLVARAKGYAPAFEAVSGIGENETISDIVIRLEAGAEVAGAVVDVAGTPVPDALIFLGEVPQHLMWQFSSMEQGRMMGMGRQFGQAAQSDEQGLFRLESLPAGPTEFSVWAEGFTLSSAMVELVSTRENEVELVLSRGGVIEGRITEGGRGVENQQVQVYYREPPGMHRSAQTDADGYYSIAGLPDGEATVNCHFNANGSRRNRSSVATVAAERVTVVDFTFVESTASISGTVYGMDDAPLQAGHVYATTMNPDRQESFSTRIDSTGSYTLPNLPSGTLNVAYMTDGQDRRSFEVQVGEGEAVHRDVYFSDGASLICMLANVPEGNSMQQVVVFRGQVALPERTEEAFRDFWQGGAIPAGKDSDGNFTVGGLEPGTYTVMAINYPAVLVQGEDYFANMEMTSEEVVIRDGDKVTEINLRF
jgi:hypothetical protein